MPLRTQHGADQLQLRIEQRPRPTQQQNPAVSIRTMSALDLHGRWL